MRLRTRGNNFDATAVSMAPPVGDSQNNIPVRMFGFAAVSVANLRVGGGAEGNVGPNDVTFDVAMRHLGRGLIKSPANGLG